MLSAVLSTMTHRYEVYFPGVRTPPRILSTSMEHRHLSDVARVRFQLARGSTEIYIKFHKHPSSPDERVRRKAKLEYETLKWLFEAFASVPGCSVVRPIAYFSEYKAVVTEKAEGVSLYAWLNRPFHTLLGSRRKSVEEWCYQAGYWLRKFQELTAKCEKEKFESDAIRGEIESILQRCETLGFSHFFRQQVGTWLRSELDLLDEPAVEVVGQHPDFHPQNILVTPTDITVLDFTSFRYGNRYYDLACFLTFLDSRLKHPFFRPAQVDHLRASFLRGYRLLTVEDPLLRLYCVKEMLDYCATLRSRIPRSFWSLGLAQRFFLRWAKQRAIPILE